MASSKGSVEVTLKLTAREALWIKCESQNAEGAEGSEAFNTRVSIFKSLPTTEDLNMLISYEEKNVIKA